MIRKRELPVLVLVVALSTAACGSKTDSASSAELSADVGGRQASAADEQGDDDAGSEPNKAVAAVDPCALLTDAEIVDQLEKAQEPNNLAAWKAKGGSWKITPTPEQKGISKECHYAFVGDAPDGNFIHKSDFTVVVTDGAFVNPKVNNAGKRPIPGVGDEAYFMSHGPMMPYARVGKVAVGLEGFPSTPAAKAGADLLRLAVGRVRR